MKKFELSIDHPVLKHAKIGFDACVKHAVAKAISTKSMEGTVSLKISFEIEETINNETGELQKIPKIKFKSQYSVPIKEGAEGTVTDKCSIMADQANGQWMLVSNQVCIDELLDGDEEEDG